MWVKQETCVELAISPPSLYLPRRSKTSAIDSPFTNHSVASTPRFHICRSGSAALGDYEARINTINSVGDQLYGLESLLSTIAV
jgi:hypothetical protein